MIWVTCNNGKEGVFILIPRNGSTTLTHALLNKSDAHHLSALRIREKDHNRWNNAVFRAAVVRDPIERIESWWIQHQELHPYSLFPTINAWYGAGHPTHYDYGHQHWNHWNPIMMSDPLRQGNFIEDIEGNQIVERLILLQHLERKVHNLAERYDFSVGDIKRYRNSDCDRKDLRNRLSEINRENARHIYLDDYFLCIKSVI